MKKALLVTEDFYPFLGGVSTYWEHLGEHMPIHDWVVLAPLLSRGAQEKQTLYRIYRKKFYRKWLFPRWIPIFFHIASVCKREHIQMIVVTHNRETMSRAGVLYGVTVGADGASKLLSVKFEEAQAIAK